MERMDIFFMLIGVGYCCYLFMELLLRLEYQSRRRERKRKAHTQG